MHHLSSSDDWVQMTTTLVSTPDVRDDHVRSESGYRRQAPTSAAWLPTIRCVLGREKQTHMHQPQFRRNPRNKVFLIRKMAGQFNGAADSPPLSRPLQNQTTPRIPSNVIVQPHGERGECRLKSFRPHTATHYQLLQGLGW